MASADHYRAHLQPIYEALPEHLRGRLLRRPLPNPPGPKPKQRSVRAALVGSWRDLRAVAEHGYEWIALAEHGIGQSYGTGHPGYPGGIKRDRVDLFLSPNWTAAEADATAYPNAVVAVVGDPALDALPTGPRDGPVAVSFHWDCMVAPETRSTFRYWQDAIGALAAEREVIGHAHPRFPSLKSHYRRMGIRYVADWHEVCRTAAAYVCDNSSTIYEFASTGRPVVLLNSPTYRRNVELGLRFWAAASVGLQVDRPLLLAETVQRAVEADTADIREAREAALDLAYGYRSGAAHRAAEVITGCLA